MKATQKLVKFKRVEKKKISFVKILFWLYFVLLITEGALRKWIVPGLSAPLLLVRDPIGLWIIWESIRTHKWPKNFSIVTGALSVSFVILSVVQLLLDICPWFAIAYGLRSYLLTFPVAFAMSNIITREDIDKLCKYTMVISLPMTFIYFQQYRSPADSWINLGAYEGASQITYVGAHVRAAGTFSFVTGSISFQGMLAAFAIFALFDAKIARRWFVYTTLIVMIFAIPLVGARTLIFIYIGEAVCVVIASMLGVSQLMNVVKLVIPFFVAALLLPFIPAFNEASNSLTARFASAEATQGSTEDEVYKRVIGPYLEWFEKIDASKPLGVGIGRGAAAITQMMVGRASFETGEDELSRNIFEMGYIFGGCFVAFRVIFACYLFFAAIVSAREGRPLALLLSPAVLSEVVSGILEQPSRQGFMILGMAVMIAGMKNEDRKINKLYVNARDFARKGVRK